LDLLEVFKIVKGFEGLKENDFFELSEEAITRGHSYKFFKKRVIKNYGLYSFGNRIVTYWNRLPDTLMQLNDINNFKKGLDHCLGHTWGLK